MKYSGPTIYLGFNCANLHLAHANFFWYDLSVIKYNEVKSAIIGDLHRHFSCNKSVTTTWKQLWAARRKAHSLDTPREMSCAEAAFISQTCNFFTCHIVSWVGWERCETCRWIGLVWCATKRRLCQRYFV